MGVPYTIDHLDASATLAALLDEFSAVTNYRTLRDNLPRRLAVLLKCRCVLFYQRLGETLQFASGSFADQPGWSAALLAVAHINPIELGSSVPEAQAWRARKAVSASEHAQICTPLIYRQRAIGVLTAMRGAASDEIAAQAVEHASAWQPEEIALVAVAANVVAMLLENTRLLERDRERIHELSLLNGITSQMNCGLRERERVYRIVIQRAKEIALPDLCSVLTADTGPDMPAWLPSQLQRNLLKRWQSDIHAAPLVLERGSTRQAVEYMKELDARIKTFFAFPLIGKRGSERGRMHLQFAAPRLQDSADEGTSVHGVLVGAYHKSWQLRREEQVLLHILVNQASAVMENITLMDDVIEARNEARRLLRQVLDDQRFKELTLENIPSGLITIDLQEKITTFNQAAESVLGYHPREVLGQSVRKILRLRSLERALRTGQPQHETLLTVGRQGQEIALDITLVPLRGERSRQMGVLATFADITSIYHLEEEKRRLDRLASLGEMSANVAHEVRNPLASIKTSMQMLRDDLESNRALDEDASVQDEIAVVLKEVERLDGIVRDLLLFARPRQLHRVEHNLCDLCERLLRFLQPQFEERGVRIHQAKQESTSVSIDVAQMEQVFMNIFLNALQAMPDGGILSLSCQVITSSEGVDLAQDGPSEESQPTLSDANASNASETEQGEPSDMRTREQRVWRPGTWLELVVSDTGVGIAQESLERIFQPFYTTKAHGIGLGLPITRRLVEDHHGYLLVESQLGYGTSVSVRLPCSDEAGEVQA